MKLTLTLLLFLPLLSLAQRSDDDNRAILNMESIIQEDSVRIHELTLDLERVKGEREILINSLNDARRIGELSVNLEASYLAQIADRDSEIASLEKEMKKGMRKVKFWKTVAIVEPVIIVVALIIVL